MPLLQTAPAVTFGGSHLDRAAQLRDDQAALAEIAVVQIIVFWRGKVLCHRDAQTGAARLCFLERNAKLLDHCAVGSQMFLGLSEVGAGYFARELRDWTPELPDDVTLNAFSDQSEQVHPDAPEGAVFLELRSIMMTLSPREAEVAATARALLNWHGTHGFCARCGSASDIVQAGWQRKCPRCGASHFPRTDPVVIMLVTYHDRVLLGRSHGWPAGMYSALAGFVEPGETIEAAVRREVLEEVGITTARVAYIADQPWPYPNSLMFGCVAEATSTQITLDPNELDDARWLTRQEAMDVFCGSHPDISSPRKGAIARFLLENWLADRFVSQP
ncbi:NAD(+) diphosphatase [Rhodobacteraceae bacterium XHP0102]|nr:NAD(+) diphosphatase [Rhodobacteraceae bacterium XHP0102]